MCWTVYIVECSDGTLYTGVAKELDKRISQHNAGEGAKYTRARLPVKVVYTEQMANRSEAQQREYAIKQLKRSQKQALIISSVHEP